MCSSEFEVTPGIDMEEVAAALKELDELSIV